MDEPPHDVEGVVCLTSLGQNQWGHSLPAIYKIDKKRVYLEICFYFQQVFTKNHLHDFKTTSMRLKGDCKSVTTYSKHKGWWQLFHMWLVEFSITNLIIVIQLKVDGFTIDYNTNRNWVVTTPEGE